MDDQSREADAVPGSTPADAQRRAMIERVLREALLAGGEDALIAAEQAALRRVAARHPGQALTLEPATVEIVAALLGAAFGVRVEDSPMCIEMSRTIARSLWSDVVVRDRVESLWKRLSEQAG